MTIDPATGVIDWTPTASQVGSQRVTLTVTDAAGNVASQSYTLLVQAANRPPVINSTAVQSATAGLVYRYDVQASDPDGDALTYRLTTAPAGMTIDALGRITWATAVADIGTHPVTVVVADPFGASVSQSFDLTVSADTQAPRVIVDLSTSQADLGSQVTIFVSATDNVGVADLVLTVNGTPLPVDANGRAIFHADQVGTFDVVGPGHRRRRQHADGAATTLIVIDPTRRRTPPVVELTVPPTTRSSRRRRTCVGTVTDDNLLFYTLSVAPAGQRRSSPSSPAARAPSPTASWARSTRRCCSNDSYILRLEATDAGGNIATVDRRSSRRGRPEARQLHAVLHRPDGAGVRHPDHRDADLRHAHRRAVGRPRLRLAAGVPRHGPPHQRRADRACEEYGIFNPLPGRHPRLRDPAGRQARGVHLPAASWRPASAAVSSGIFRACTIRPRRRREAAR